MNGRRHPFSFRRAPWVLRQSVSHHRCDACPMSGGRWVVDVVPVSRRTGVDVITGQGLTGALRGAEVVVDLADVPSRGEKSSTEFFTTATVNLLRAAAL